MDYVPLEETSKPLSIGQLALRWYGLFPQEFSIERADSESHALNIIKKSIGVFLKANGTSRLEAIIKQEFRPKRGGFVVGGVDGVHRERPLVSINVYYFDPVEVNRFEAECFIKPSHYKSHLVVEGDKKLDRLKKKAFLDLVMEIKEMERKSNFPTAEEFIEQQPKYIEVPEIYLSIQRSALERERQQQRIADMQEERLRIELEQLKGTAGIDAQGQNDDMVLEQKKKGRAGSAKDFVSDLIEVYKNENKVEPSSIKQLLAFATSKEVPGYGCITISGSGNDKHVFYGLEKEEITYRAVSGAFVKYMEKENKRT